MTVTLYNARAFVSVPENLPIAFVYGSKHYFKLLTDVEVLLSNGDTITIPYGYKWDLASVPYWLTPIFRRYGDHLLAYLIHDYLWTECKYYGRSFTDREMKRWADALNDNWSDNLFRYLAVRWRGRKVWTGEKKLYT